MQHDSSESQQGNLNSGGGLDIDKVALLNRLGIPPEQHLAYWTNIRQLAGDLISEYVKERLYGRMRDLHEGEQ